MRIKDMIINGYSWYQTRKYKSSAALKDKNGQAILEYTMLFVAAVMGMAISLDMLGTTLKVAMVRQASSIVASGGSLF